MNVGQAITEALLDQREFDFQWSHLRACLMQELLPGSRHRDCLRCDL